MGSLLAYISHFCIRGRNPASLEVLHNKVISFNLESPQKLIQDTLRARRWAV